MGDNKEIPRISFEHKELHDGDMYMAYNDELTMQTTETINFAFKTPASTTKEIHMIIDFSTLVGGTLEVLEAATWTAQTGTAFVPINKNRLSSNTSEILGNETTTTFTTANEIAYDVTTVLTTNATTIEFVRAATAANKEQAPVRAQRELILKSSTTYVIRFTAVGNSNSGFLRLVWYEHLPNVI